MRSSYKDSDVILLLKDITGMVKPLPTEERERLIQGGVHYCEMLPQEYEPTDAYMRIYHNLLDKFAQRVANAVMWLGEELYSKYGRRLVLVSLARAGIPAGILVKRYLDCKYNIEVPHYGISIIRGRGIDKNAMKHILDKYFYKDLVFIDGWTGKGAIKTQLDEACSAYGMAPKLGVIADPAGVAEFYGTRDDLLIPSSCLNSTISGLISRTFLRDDIIGKNDYHGAVYYSNLQDKDESYDFINCVASYFTNEVYFEERSFNDTGLDEAKRLQKEYGISDINFVKPGIGETTRVLLRRVPDKVVISSTCKDDEDLQHIYQLAEEKGVPIVYNSSMKHYKCCGLIKSMGDV